MGFENANRTDGLLSTAGTSERLEGSRFAVYPVDQTNLFYESSGRNGLEKQAAPANNPAFGSAIGLSNRNTGGINLALGNSREPPAFTFPSRNTW
jgi:hypothetical protein